VWDNVDGPPAAPVDVVRILLTGGEHLIVEDCTVESRVNGDSEIGHPTTVQLFYTRHMPTALSTVSYVEILGGSYKTAYSGSSTIALGCNCDGPTEWLLSNVVAEGPIALDAKGFTPDGSPLDWMLINTHLITRVQSSGAPRCWKQNGDVRFVSLAGSSCTRGLLQFGGGAGQLHNLDGLLIKDAPIDSSGALIVATTSHGFEGTIDVEGAPGDGDPGDNRSHNLFFATAGLGAVDLEVEFDACHRAFSPDSGMGDFTLDLRPGVVEEHRLYLRGPAGCGNPTEFWNSTTLQTLADSETQGYLLTDGGVSFELVDGVPVPVPEPGSLPMLVTGIAFVIALGRRRVRL
jgi:hypothetical protein